VNNITETGATLQLLKLTDVGPAEEFEFEPAPRLNIITGDNGLGKTFLLDCAWWALTGEWAGAKAYPYQATMQRLPGKVEQQNGAKRTPSIAFQIGKNGRQSPVYEARYNRGLNDWGRDSQRPTLLPGLSIFAQADGSFTIWDPAKLLWADMNPHAEPLLRLSRSQVWNGVRKEQDGEEVVPCPGLLQDWIYWQNADKPLFDIFSAALKTLSPHPTEMLIPGTATRLPPDGRAIPTLKFSYGEVPVTLCSAGIQHILALAYVLVWAWNEHIVISGYINRAPEHSIILLIDDIETHLHPFWQRTIIPALMSVLQKLTSQAQAQILLATHSPLVLASVEPTFDEKIDKLFHLYLENGSVKLEHVPFVKRGRVDRWLISDLFGLQQARSREAEEAIEEAKRLQQVREPTTEEVKAVSDKLLRTLAEDDDFWHRWTYFAEQRGVML
jgi:hypothetical protein